MPVVRFDQGGRDIVATLRAMLADAEAGRITCLAAVAGLKDGESGSAFCAGTGEGVLAAMGEMRIVEARALAWLREVNGGRL